MPMYRYKDERTGTEIDVLRSFDEWEVPPNREETQQHWSDSEFEKAEWTRVIGIPGVVKGHGWGGGKGNW